MCRVTPAVTSPANSITPAVAGLPACSIIPDVTGLATVINLAAFTTYINYVSLRRIAVNDQFGVCLQFILPLIDPARMA